MDQKLFEYLRAKVNIYEDRGKVVIENPMQKSHYRAKAGRNGLLGVWWYHPLAHIMSYSATALSHMDLDKFPELKDNIRGWVRGRLFDDEGKKVVFTYMEDWPKNYISGFQASDLITKIENASGIPVEYLVDEVGNDLLGV